MRAIFRENINSIEQWRARGEQDHISFCRLLEINGMTVTWLYLIERRLEARAAATDLLDDSKKTPSSDPMVGSIIEDGRTTASPDAPAAAPAAAAIGTTDAGAAEDEINPYRGALAAAELAAAAGSGAFGGVPPELAAVAGSAALPVRPR